MNFLSDNSLYQLNQATHEQIQLTYSNNYVEWGISTGLTLEQYMKRENALGTCDFVQQRRTVWLLQLKERRHANRELPPDYEQYQNEIFAQCETYRRPCLVYGERETYVKKVKKVLMSK
jgi:hypothetical protein